jgi:hypothetical protein
MMEIYRSTARVVAWLGPNKPRDDIYIEFLFKLAERFEKESKDRRDQDMEPRKREISEALMRNGRDAELIQTLLRAFLLLFQRPWFKRIWIVQETILGTRLPLFFAGQHMAGMFGFFRLWSFLESATVHDEALHRTVSDMPGLRDLMVLGCRFPQVTDRPGSSANGAQFLLELLYATYGHQSTLPHDRIYGLYGLFRATIGEASIPQHLLPDYNLPINQIYHSYVSFIVEYTGDLRILMTSRAWIAGLPTWATDLRPSALQDNQPRTKASPIISADGFRLVLHEIIVDQCTVTLPLASPASFNKNFASEESRRLSRQWIEERI